MIKPILINASHRMKNLQFLKSEYIMTLPWYLELIFAVYVATCTAIMGWALGTLTAITVVHGTAPLIVIHIVVIIAILCYGTYKLINIRREEYPT